MRRIQQLDSPIDGFVSIRKSELTLLLRVARAADALRNAPPGDVTADADALYDAVDVLNAKPRVRKGKK